MIKKTRDEIYYWAAFNKEKKMHAAIESIKGDLEKKDIKEDIKEKEKIQEPKSEQKTLI
jgi:ERCC4-related helicase